jgi:glucokinase
LQKTNVVLGVDIGGTNSKFGFVDSKGNCLLEGSILTEPETGAEDLFSRLFDRVKRLLNENTNFNMAGIGIGAPNANYYKGTVEHPPNLNWGIVDVIAIIKRYYDIPAAITNDANAAAIGEFRFGAARGMKDFIVITLGTGLGSGIFCNGQLVLGHDGFAGEIGHTIAIHGGRECGCGRKGCLETYASANGIRRTVFELIAETNYPSVLRENTFANLTSKDIYDAAMKGDIIALMAFDFTGKILGRSLADAAAYTSPEAIILFGGLASAGALIIEPTKKYMEENLLNIFKDKVRIIPSGLSGGNAAILGSAALIWNEMEKEV